MWSSLEVRGQSPSNKFHFRCVESMLNNEIFQSIKPDFGTFCLCGHKKYIDNFFGKSLTERHNDNNISILKIM